MSKNMSADTVTRLIPEEDLIDGLFYKCDINKNGRVCVSRLIRYLTSTAGQDKQSLAAIENLSEMFDPHASDIAIDLLTYRKCINKWIQQVRQSKRGSSVSEELMPRNPLKRQKSSLFYPDNHFPTFLSEDNVSSHIEGANMSASVLDASSLDTSTRHFESEISELTSQVGDLQHQNRKLVEDNSKLHLQLEAQEESMNTMNQDHVITKKKIKSLQELVDLRSETQEENEELKTTLTKYQDKRKELENRLNQVERENTSLQAQITDYESKLQILLCELENANIQQKSLQSTLIEQKQLLKKLAEERTMHEVTLSEKQTQIQDLEICVDELNKMNEELKYEHDDLQMQFIQAQQEITNYHMKDDKPNMSNSSGCVDDLEVEGEVLEAEHVSSHESTAYSTPVKQTSIHNEIKEMLEDSLHLPSPLSDKELQESILAQSFSSGGDSWTTEDLIDLEVASFMPSNGDNDKIKTLDGIKLVKKFKEQQDSFTQQIDEVISAVDANPDRGSYSRRLFTDSDGEEEAISSNGISNEENLHSERRYQRLILVLQKLKGENERLIRLHDEAVESVSNWEMTVDSTLDNRLTVLRDVLLEERALKKQHQREVQSLRSVVNETKRQLKDKEELTQQLQQQEADLEAQMTLLKKTNLDLAEKCHKSELRASDLQDDILQSTFNFEREKHRNNDLEDTLAGTKLARQLDLRDIWRLVQKDVETEYMDDQDSPLSSSTDLLKEQITKEIESLKDKLVKRQVALGALKGKPMKLKLDSSGNYCQPMDTSPSSPLVDALTIDFFNGNYPTTRPNKRANTLSALNQYSSLDRDSCAVCQKNSNAPSHHTLSCPSLHQRHCYHDPESHSNYSYTNLNTSSSSSTSGVDVSPRCSRSVDGQNRRRDFIRSSIKYGSGSQTSAESNANSDSSHHRQHKYSRSVGDRMHKKDNVRVSVQSPAGFRRPSFTNAIENRKDANDNNVSQFTRSRSLSFQAAIERGRRSPVDEVDFLSTSPDSTPDRSEYPQYVQQDMAASSRNDGKSVSFHLSTEEYFDSCSELPAHDPDPRYHERTDTAQSTAHDVAFSAQLTRQTSVQSARKLSTLIEEESDLSEALSDKMGTPKLIKRIVDEYATPTKNRFCAQMSESDNFVSFDDSRDYEKSSTSRTGETETQAKETKQEKEAKKSKKTSQGDTGQTPAKNKDKSMDKTTLVISDAPKSTSSKASEKKPQMRVEESLVVPNSPENGLVEEPRLSPKASPKSKTPSRLAKLRQNNLAKKRDHMRTMKLPELREQSEGDMAPPQLLTLSENTLTPPPPSQDSVTPSLPDEFLEKLGLKMSSPEEKVVNVDELPENEIERKFCSLALAFKTDKLTLEKRKGIQERSRDLAEENVDRELGGLRDAAEELNQSVTDAKLRDVIQKIQGHIEILEQSAAKVSSRAEVFGAVQQENRMSTAMEIMITYVNHLRSLYDKEHAELEDARKILHDKPFGQSVLHDLDRSNRSMSVAALSAPLRTRRRSEVVLPRMCGGAGSPLLRHSASLDYPFFTEPKQHGGSKEIVTDDEDPRQRFQALVGNTQMRNAVATTFRRGSLERQASVQSSKSSSFSLSRDSSTEKIKESKENGPPKQGSQEEEAYHRGFEDGVKAKLGHELSDLREKQNNIGQSLEDVMDKVEKSKEEDEREKEEAAERRMMQMRALGLHKPSWDNAGHTFRMALAGLIFMIAVGMVIMTILPGSASGMEVHTDVQHFGVPPV
ncbi:inositol 1,4,5-triphosphate receptor associated 2-like isoform X2 [Haliotis rufescens]|uniref:inositol 1,4,5-triphosphate receptor associated 2-like isoform X2 n=1 Tax=Haliotis rufescens TaxID=6454 RepID=UPI00201EE51D|nr:inositol 1,4,5-triphosphate receptor associated 2-like isoform X2 [Haliotis rufescens]